MDELDMLNEENTADVVNPPDGSAIDVDVAEQNLEAAHTSLAAAEEEVQAAKEKAGVDLSGWLRAAADEALTQKERARDRAVREVEAAAEDLAEARKQGAPPSAAAVQAPAQEESPLVYETAQEFLHEYLLPLYNRILDTRNGKWCRQWFLHPEAVSRVEALWRAWEHLRRDGQTGMSVWWKDHADVHMAVLLNQKGPFHRCDPDRHRTPEPFPCDIAPKGWFPKASEIPDQ